MGFIDPNSLLPMLVAFTLGITFHEFSHAFVADQMGDPTPRNQGRITLNPLAHMEVWGTLLIFLVGFGWGKPVMHRIRDRRQRLWVALAGPVANVILAIVFGVLLRVILITSRQTLSLGPEWFNVGAVLATIVQINLILAVFNMIPLSPLDGSSVFAGILPSPYGDRLAYYNARYPQALIFFVFFDFLLRRVSGFSILSCVLSPIGSFVFNLIVRYRI